MNECGLDALKKTEGDQTVNGQKGRFLQCSSAAWDGMYPSPTKQSKNIEMHFEWLEIPFGTTTLHGITCCTQVING